jgi:hypothetical protein
MDETVGRVTDFDDGFEELGAAAEVCPQEKFVYRLTEAASRAARRSVAASWAML